MSALAVTRIPKQWRVPLGFLGLTLFVALLPIVFHTPYALSTLILIGIYSTVTVGLCLLMGYAGQVSLGQAAFFGLGAYASAILTTRLSWSPWVSMVVAAAGTGLIAYLIGIPIFRLRGHYLAMATLGFGAIVRIVMSEWRPVTGGPTGLPGIPRLAIGGLTFNTDLSYYYLVWAVGLVAIALARNIVDSRVGRALRAVRGSEAAAESLGVDVASFKLRALVTSAVYASVGGSLYAHYMIFVSPGAFDVDTSVRLVLMAAVGGIASIWGAPLGAATVTLLTLALREIVPLVTQHGSGEHQVIAYGILLVVIMIFVPEGLTPAVVRGLQRVRQRWAPRLPRLLRRRA